MLNILYFQADETIHRRQVRKKLVKCHLLGTFKAYEIKYLKACEYKEKMEEKFEDMTVDLDLEKGEISVHGMEDDKDKAEVMVWSDLVELQFAC